MEVIREELEQVRAQFADERRTEITAASGDIDLEDLIAQEDVVVTLLTKVMWNINRLPTTKLNVVVVKVNPQRRWKMKTSSKTLSGEYSRYNSLFLEPWSFILVESISITTS